MQHTWFFNSGTWHIYKKITNKNKRKSWHPFRDRCFVINTAQVFGINDCIWYPINLMESQLVILVLTASATSGKQSAKQTKFYQILHFITFVLIHSSCGFPWKQRIRISLWRTPAKVWSNLNFWVTCCLDLRTDNKHAIL